MSEPDQPDEDVEIVEVDDDGVEPDGDAGQARPRRPPDPARRQRVRRPDLDIGGDQASQLLGRRIAEISTDRPSVLRELGLGTLQVYEALASGGWGERGETELTVVFTDLVALLRLGARAGDTAATEMLRQVDGAITPVIDEHAAAASSSGSATG